MTRLEQITGPERHVPGRPRPELGGLCVHGEGPVWDAATGRFHWVDLLAGEVLTLDPAADEISAMRVGDVAAALRPRAGGGLVLALERGFALLDAGSDRPVVLDELWDDPTIRFNDGGCDRQGRFYCGSMSYNEEEQPPVGALYRLDPDLTTSLVLDGVTISNGIVWTPDGGTVYYIDSPTQRVDAFTAEPDGTLSDRRPVVEIPAEAGMPDGMCLDTEGALWVALWGGSAVRRYLPDGTLDAVVEMPVPYVTACTFGGPDLTDLYITTSQLPADSGDEDKAGALFRYRPGVTGVPETPFAA